MEYIYIYKGYSFSTYAQRVEGARAQASAMRACGEGVDTSKYARIKVPFYVFCNISTCKDLLSFLLKPINSEMHHSFVNILK